MQYVYIFIIGLAFFIFAIFFQTKEYNDSYIQGIPLRKSNFPKILNALKICLQGSQKAIKWRVTYITSLVIVCISFLLTSQEIPSIRNIIIYFIVTYLCISLLLLYFDKVINQDIYNYGLENLKLMKSSYYKR